ncbi:MAG TPA: hypothetical protein VJT74_06800 [Pyrinomonadaceae bacterium]|nr:hypothetical protein [Pyrinomonadaceae bacterium]
MNKARPSALARAALVAAVLLLMAAPAPRAAWARTLFCACCAEPGEWYEHTGKLESYEVTELRDVKFDAVAKLYTTAAGFEGMKGLPAQYESFQLSDTFGRALNLTLTFKGERNETGSLVLRLPQVATSFGADLHDYPEGSAGPILYKEWRFSGSARGSGMFRRSVVPGTKFRLVLQGRGNNCLSSTDFKNWRLDITGPRADYAFYGALKGTE